MSLFVSLSFSVPLQYLTGWRSQHSCSYCRTQPTSLSHVSILSINSPLVLGRTRIGVAIKFCFRWSTACRSSFSVNCVGLPIYNHLVRGAETLAYSGTNLRQTLHSFKNERSSGVVVEYSNRVQGLSFSLQHVVAPG